MKKTRKRSATRRSGAPKTDDKSFLIIVGGGFLILVLGFLFFTNQGSTLTGKLSAAKHRVMQDTNVQKNVVLIKDYALIPETITVKSGDTVVWKNQDKVSHNPTATDNSFTTGTIFEGGEGSYVFTMPGTYSYYSATYPNVRGTVVVE